MMSRFDALNETIGKLNQHMETQLRYQDRLRIQDQSNKQVAEVMRRRTEPFAGQIQQAERKAPSQIVVMTGRNLGAQIHKIEPQARDALGQIQKEEEQQTEEQRASAKVQPRQRHTEQPQDTPPNEASEPPEQPSLEDQRPQKAQIFAGGGQSHIGEQKDRTKEDMDLMGWMMATQGMEGTPGQLRNFMAQRFMFDRSLGWAKQAWAGDETHPGLQQQMESGQGVAGRIGQTAVGAAAAGKIGKMLGWASENPMKAFAGRLAIGAAISSIRDSTERMGQFQMGGEELGYGAPPGGQTFLGVRNPLGYGGKAAQVGAGYDIEATRLGYLPGGSSMTPGQAKEMMGSLQAQGFGMQPVGRGETIAMGAAGMAGPVGAGVGAFFGPLGALAGGLIGDKIAAPIIRGITSLFSHPHGDAANIAAALAPTQHMTPGLKPTTLTSFTPELRYSGVSLNEFRESLKSVGIEARATKQNVDAYTKSLAQTSQQLAQSTTSSQFGSRALLQGFTGATGLPSQTGAALATNPYTQAFAAMHGVMPFAIGDMNPGAFSSSSAQGIQTLIQATQPMANMPTQYQTLPGGMRVPVIDPKKQRRDFIAKTLGIPAEQAGTLIGEMQSGRFQKRSMMESVQSGYGDQIQAERGANKNHKLTQQQYTEADNVLKTLQNNPAYQGILSKDDWRAINKSPDMQNRYTELKSRLAKSGKDDPMNQINKDTGQADGTVKVEFTGAAAKYFQQINKGVKPAKAASNAGLNSMPSGSNYASVANSVPGDLSGGNTVGSFGP